MAGEGIEFLLELNAKLDGATKMVRELNRVEAALGHGDKAFKRMEEHGGGALHKLGDWFRELGGEATHTFTSMFAAQAVWDTMKEGVHEIKAMAVEMLEVAGHAERTRMAFENMLGVEPGHEMLEYLERVSKSTEFGVESVKQYGQELLEAGFDAGNLDRALASVADVASRSPDKMAGAGGAVAALSRAMLSGTIDARSLRRIKLAPGAFYKQMAGDLGISTKEVQKQLAAGKISKENLINSIFKALAIKGGGTLGAAGAKMSEGFEARWLKFREIGEEIFKGLADSPGLVKLGEVMQGITEIFDPKSPGGRSIIRGISETMTKVAEALGAVDWSSVGEGIIGSAKQAFAVIEAAAKVGGSMVSALDSVWNASQEASRAVVKLASGKDIGTTRTRDRAEGLAEGGPTAEQKADDARFRIYRKSFKEGAARTDWVTSPEAAEAGLGVRGISPMRLPEAGPAKPHTVTVHAPVTVSIGGSTSSAGEVGQKVGTEVTAAVVAALEQMGLQTGSA